MMLTLKQTKLQSSNIGHSCQRGKGAVTVQILNISGVSSQIYECTLVTIRTFSTGHLLSSSENVYV